ncbi:RidA family protein (plasmid) [Sinorhizobium meliloti]|nr:RidA family protein [Sinorhizobium meliloti]
MFEKIETGIAASRAPLSGTVKVGRIVRSAHIAKNPETGELVTWDIECQARQVFSNLRQALEAAGSTLAAVVQIQVYLVDRADAPGHEQDIPRILRASISRAGDSRHGAPFTRHPPGNSRHCGLLPGLRSSKR